MKSSSEEPENIFDGHGQNYFGLLKKKPSTLVLVGSLLTGPHPVKTQSIAIVSLLYLKI